MIIKMFKMFGRGIVATIVTGIIVTGTIINLSNIKDVWEWVIETLDEEAE